MKRTPELDGVIKDYHPYYSAKSDYTHFLVLTQSCDLVRRDGKPCVCRYISLATVRPLHVAIEREAVRYKSSSLLRRANAISNKDKGRLHMFMERLLNNNEKEYFYLHEDPLIGLASSCAFLRLSISIRSDEHYEICQKARVASLRDDFKAKLGWLVGHIFSRVGTVDWEATALKKQIAKSLEENIVWLDDQKIKASSLSEEEANSMTSEAIIERVQSVKVIKKKDKVIGAVLAELRKGDFIKAEDTETIERVLKVAPTVSASIGK